MGNAPVPIEVLLEHSDWLVTLARALAGDEHRADDVVQETWRAALTSPPRHGANLRAWLATVARNATRQVFRRETRRSERERAAARREPVPDPSRAVERMELARRIANAVAELPEPSRTAVILRYFDGVAPAAIAERLGVPAGTVRSRISRGIALLRERLDREEPGGRPAWLALLLPLLPRPIPPRVPAGGSAAGNLLAGAIVMSTKVKVGLFLVVALFLVGGVLWMIGPASRDGDVVGPARPASPPGPGEVTRLAIVGGETSATAGPGTEQSLGAAAARDRDGKGIHVVEIHAAPEVPLQAVLAATDTVVRSGVGKVQFVGTPGPRAGQGFADRAKELLADPGHRTPVLTLEGKPISSAPNAPPSPRDG